MNDTPSSSEENRENDTSKKLNIEEEELKLKQRELTLKEKEFEHNKKKKWNPSIITAIIAGILGLFGTLYTTYKNTSNTIRLEEKKLESSLIQKAIDTKDPNKSLKNLKFLDDVGLVRHLNLEKVLKDSSKIPATRQEYVLREIKGLVISGNKKELVNGLKVEARRYNESTKTDETGTFLLAPYIPTNTRYIDIHVYTKSGVHKETIDILKNGIVEIKI